MKFKNQQGLWITKRLFIDVEKTPYAMYTYGREDKVLEDGKVYPSLYRLYMECEDIHEVDFANKYLGGYEHWLEVQNCYFIKPLIEEWRAELELVLMSKGLKTIGKLMDSPIESLSLAAAKYYANRSWDVGIHKNPTTEKSRGRGRPSNQTLQQKLMLPKEEDFQADLDRLRKN
jgi:hypothetical protein